MTIAQRQSYINDHFDTMAQIIARKFCLEKEAVKRWLNKKGYTASYEDFGKVIQETKKANWLEEVLEANDKEVNHDRI